MDLEGKRILQLVHDDFEDLELWYPVYRLREAGAEVVIAGEHPGHVYTGKYGVPCKADQAFSETIPERCDAVLIPGGWAPDKLRRFEEVLTIVKWLDDNKRPIGQICHAGWVSISAGIVLGRHVTSTPGIKDDMVNAGGLWKDESVVVDRNLVSSRRPPDLPDYMRAFIEVVANS
jgi:protease I